MTVAAFRPLVPKSLKPRRKVDLDELGHVTQQMQGLIDSGADPENKTEVAFLGLVQQWHAMLMKALIEEAKTN